jgi:hypothetical protein
LRVCTASGASRASRITRILIQATRQAH